ncbi:energy transducer TonB [Sphingomonas lacusdianchii]|uniref:energy transducer TonB n=1 Tax=Sphingomonas lacusdianchii TaxID=2917992 RepID=UPI001F585F09|nr:energy transducer TonB [Sphingomonas sp. JXJ CY 53]
MRLLLSAALLIGQGGVATPPPLLAPASRWTVEYAEKMCVVARGYGDPAHPIFVAFKPTPFGEFMQAVVLGNRAQLGKEGWFDLTLEAPGRAFDKKQSGTRLYFPEGDRAVLTFYISRAEFEGLVDAPTFTVRPKNGPVISVALAMTKALLPALKKCEVDLMQRFGYDPEKVAAVVTRAEGERPGEWINQDDYPASSLSKGEQGVVVIAWTIAANARVTDCKVIQSSGSNDLDKAACDAILRRGRYLRPALDAAGKPVESYSTRRVMWQLPRRG